MTLPKEFKSVFAHRQVGRISGADLISLLDTGKLLAVDTRPVEDWKMGSLSHRFSVIFYVDVILQSTCCCHLLCLLFVLSFIFYVRVRFPIQCFHSRLFCLHSHWRASCWRKRSGGGEKERQMFEPKVCLVNYLLRYQVLWWLLWELPRTNPQNSSWQKDW